jgi:hypothetical protein
MNKTVTIILFHFLVFFSYSQTKIEVNVTTISPCKQSELTKNGDKSSLTIYPNPNTGKFIIELPFNSGKIQLINAIGQIVYTQTIDKNKVKIDTSIPSGIYTIQIIQNESIISEKIEIISK